MDINSGSASTATDAATEPTRAEGLWFEDCGLIIQAENTLFRVSRDMLATHSPVFRDMLSLPPPTADDMIEGCPFVRLPDSAADVTVFLKSLFYFDFFRTPPAPIAFAIVAGVLRMSHKYEVDALRKLALAHFSSFHPTTLHEYEQRGREEQSSFFDDLHRGSFLAPIELARQLSLDWSLPIAFYRVSKYSYEHQIIGGHKGFELDMKDKISTIVAARQMERADTKILDFLWSPEVIDGCESEPECTISRIACRRDAENWRECTPNASPLMPLDIWATEDWERLEVCDVCLATMKTMHQDAKQAFWDELPKMFDLPNWTVLEEMKAEGFK
ncbi:hypothetical protein C8R43DRAFT_877584 [Mycena crocata]|nr:hypothetical protein C8R43DRAFT_877584 [Mycena crocata]